MSGSNTKMSATGSISQNARLVDQHGQPSYDRLIPTFADSPQSLEDIIQHMRDHYNFTPSKRAFQTQFKRWEFPSKQNPAHRNDDLVIRVKDLWEQNYSQRDMLKTLNDEGYEIKERELMRVRAKNRWLLRIANGNKPPSGPLPVFESELLQAAGRPIVEESEDLTKTTVPEEVLRKRKERHDHLQAESDERWAAKKRRRRTKSYAGMAADPPGPPRFPSETTLEEGQQFLSLDKKQYRALRDHFQRICEEEGVIKKTLAGTDKWRAVKDRLIQEDEHLQKIFWVDTNGVETKQLALDVICTDVTKRMRVVDRQMTIVDAKNILGLNPEKSREIRTAFYAILQADHFISKLEIGNDRWEELKEQWIAESPLLQEVLAPGHADAEHEKKRKALEVLCRDVRKRLRDDQTKRYSGKLSGKGNLSNDLSMTPETASPQNRPTDPAALATAATATITRAVEGEKDVSDLQIDPSLLQTSLENSEAASMTPIAVYIRPHPQSQIHASDKMWLASMLTQSMSELRSLLSAKWPDAVATRIDGICTDANGQISWGIDEDEELEAYLDKVKSRKAIFLVFLSPQ